MPDQGDEVVRLREALREAEKGRDEWRGKAEHRLNEWRLRDKDFRAVKDREDQGEAAKDYERQATQQFHRAERAEEDARYYRQMGPGEWANVLQAAEARVAELEKALRKIEVMADPRVPYFAAADCLKEVVLLARAALSAPPGERCDGSGWIGGNVAPYPAGGVKRCPGCDNCLDAEKLRDGWLLAPNGRVVDGPKLPDHNIRVIPAPTPSEDAEQ
jgi:hypothetical protein